MHKDETVNIQKDTMARLDTKQDKGYLSNIMIDLESKGSKPSSAILTIGAVFFCPFTGEIGDAFYAGASPNSGLNAKRTEDKSTMNWFWNQNEVREAKAEAFRHEEDLGSVLLQFKGWVRARHNLTKVKVWGNGISMDLGLLSNAYALFSELTGTKTSPPWHYSNEQDFRTVKRLCEAASLKVFGMDYVSTKEFKGLQHHALYDAIHEAEMVSDYVNNTATILAHSANKGQKEVS